MYLEFLILWEYMDVLNVKGDAQDHLGEELRVF
jgi:hypothetical protein